jgi:acetyl-CoA synthetase
MGKPVPLYDVDIVDPEGNSVETGTNGEIVIRLDKGEPCGLVAEYYNDEEATNRVPARNMYHTGDLAWKDEDGYYWYVGRADDLIKSSGYRIGRSNRERDYELPYVLECESAARRTTSAGRSSRPASCSPRNRRHRRLKEEIQSM